MTIPTIWRKRCFNSRTREGCDKLIIQAYAFFSLFQFTHPGGVRRVEVITTVQLCVFQFTHPGGVRR